MTMKSRDGGPASSTTGSGLDAAVALFHSLSDGTRLAIVRRLTEGEARVADLVGELGLAQSTVSAHVACLRECRLV
ncbi:MAG: ArsR/SmtB family transcription factor, partial [Pseudonocardiaceae bacterium]